jgi:hypothetical protein
MVGRKVWWQPSWPISFYPDDLSVAEELHESDWRPFKSGILLLLLLFLLSNFSLFSYSWEVFTYSGIVMINRIRLIGLIYSLTL